MNDKYQKYQKSLQGTLNKYSLSLPREVQQLIAKAKISQFKKNHVKPANDPKMVERVKSGLQQGLEIDDIVSQLHPKVYVFEFVGDMMVTGMTVFRKEVSIILSVATKYDKVVCILTSFGGVVHGYGLAASQLARIRKAGIKLTICVDSAAASGGYMMACVANKLVAAPTAFVGSIGVVSYRPNFQKLVKKANIDMYLLTSGHYKRTIDVVGEVTEEGVQKAQDELTSIHESFKSHIKMYRPQLDIEKVATGEAWLASETVEKNLDLVDELMTSDEYIDLKCKTHDVIRLKKRKEKGIGALFSKLETSYEMACCWANEFSSFRSSYFT